MPQKRGRNRPTLPQPLTPAARLERETFLRRYRELMEKIRDEVALTVFVWGPNPRAKTAAAAKRLAIRDALRRDGHNAQFSESIPLVSIPSAAPRASEKSKEYAQARLADLIIILLEDAPGALAEAHDFGEDLDIIPNLRIFIPRRYRHGYSGKGMIADLEQGWRCVQWYGPAELRKCSVLTAALKAAEARRQVMYRARRKGLS